jgi:hypothetical protein
MTVRIVYPCARAGQDVGFGCRAVVLRISCEVTERLRVFGVFGAGESYRGLDRSHSSRPGWLAPIASDTRTSLMLGRRKLFRFLPIRMGE